MTFSEFERVLNHCPHFTNFWLFLRVGEFCLLVLLTSMIFESIGITIKRLPPFCPMMNSRCENFIRALKTECLDKIIFSTREQIRLAVTEFLKYWNHYRVHEGIGGNMILPYPQDPDGEVVEVSFLGGLLHGYRRERVAA